MAASQVQPDAREQFADAAPDLEQAQPQGVELHERVPPGTEPAPQGIEQPVRRGVQEQAKLVGPEAAVTQAIGYTGALQLSDPEFGFATGHVEIVERLRLIGARGDDKAGVGAFVVTTRLGLVDDTARVVPG